MSLSKQERAKLELELEGLTTDLDDVDDQATEARDPNEQSELADASRELRKRINDLRSQLTPPVVVAVESEAKSPEEEDLDEGQREVRELAHTSPTMPVVTGIDEHAFDDPKDPRSLNMPVVTGVDEMVAFDDVTVQYPEEWEAEEAEANARASAVEAAAVVEDNRLDAAAVSVYKRKIRRFVRHYGARVAAVLLIFVIPATVLCLVVRYAGDDDQAVAKPGVSSQESVDSMFQVGDTGRPAKADFDEVAAAVHGMLVDKAAADVADELGAPDESGPWYNW